MTTVTETGTPAPGPTLAARPQDDLFRAVNGEWLATSTIPDDRATFGTFSELHDRAEADVRAIIEEAAASPAPPGSPERMVGDLYASFMDTAALDQLGTAPLGPLLERVGTVVDAESLLGVTGELQREGVDGLVDVGVWIDRGDPTRYVLHAGQGGLGLPDESYYREEGRAAIREAYVAHIDRMLALTGIQPPGETDTADVARRVMALETRLAAAHWDAVACRDAVRTYNLLSGDAVEASLPGWGAWLLGHGVPAAARAEVVVAQPDALEAFAAALREVPAADWRAWLTWHVVRSFAPYLTDEVSAANFAFYGTTLMGAPQQRDRWKRGVGLVESLLGEAVGRLYVERHYPHEAHERMTRMVDALVEAYRERLATLEWMDQETRERALAKLAAFTPKIGMPVRWRDYSALVVDEADLVGNVRRGSAFETDRWLNRIGGPVDRDEWFMTPQTVNAYYNPAMNEIVFPAAILQPPMFDLEADDADNYGGIGAVIGHEIGHGFDDQGSRYDGDGALRDWWTAQDRERFEARTGVLTRQYAGFAPSEAPDARVSGELTLGENIGDLGGVEVALHAYRLSLGGRESPVVDGRTGEERFFEGWARIWRTLTREEEARRRLAIDPHSPPEFRANVVRNVDAFHDTYGTEPGDRLWLDPEDRVRIW
ncbi:MAG: M13 family metallopeptidase [Kineosporiaceae bacterium]